jgi:chromosome segregation protein
VADLLLGRAVLVRSRHAARRLFRSVPPGVCTVSIDDGWIFHQDGRVIKPGADTGRSLLAQEREWRSLPDRLQTARANSAEAQAVLDTSEQAVAAAEARLTDLDGQERTLRAAVQDLRHDRDTAMRELDRLDQVVQWKRNQLDEIKRQIEAADASALDLAGDERELQRRQEENRVGLSRIAGQLAAVPIETLSAELARHQRALAQTEGARRHEQELVETHRRALQQLDSQIAFRRRRAEAVSVEREELLLLLASQREEADRLGEQIAKIGGEITPIEVQLAEIESQLDSMQSDEDGARRRVRAAEQIESRVQVALDRREAHLGHLATRINEELGLVNMPLDDDISGQTPLPLGEMVGELPVVRVLPDGLDDTIQQRRQQIKRLGPTNPDAPAEFAELKQRYTFLTDQVRDLRETDTRLRQVIAELDSVMDREFQRVFEAVAAEFKHTFSRLFGGGTARLVLTDPDKPIHSGVEIVARPPGRRQQGLALLSGGERSLTAAALVFSLLKVSPTPFCVLDEVDAMLDEANIGRFRDMLTELSQHTQFIIITHNWGTVQAADTIYGVSLAEDGTSQVVSLRLDGEKLRAE